MHRLMVMVTAFFLLGCGTRINPFNAAFTDTAEFTPQPDGLSQNASVPDVRSADLEDTVVLVDAEPAGTTDAGFTETADTPDVTFLDELSRDPDTDPDMDLGSDLDAENDVDHEDIATTDVPDIAGPEETVEPDDTAATDTSNPVDSAESADVVTPPGPCCQGHVGQGCELASCSIAVCSLDSYCCDTAWDDACASCASGGETFDGQPCPNFFTLCGCEPVAPPPPTPLQIAEHWAPVWYHDTDDTNYPADYITAFDFDGNTVSGDNWENLDAPDADLSAVIYWAFIETNTHWYISYLDFHPRDWANNCSPFIGEPCHENDMEGAMVVIRRDGSTYGKFEVLYTEAHNVLHIYRNDPEITKASGNLESIQVTFEDGSHPELYVEAKGHGVCALYHNAISHCDHPTSPSPPPFPGGDGIVYRYKGQAQVPSGGNDSDVGYALVPLETTLWPLRFNTCGTGCTFDGTFEYAGVPLAKAFDGDDYGDDKANPVWAWDDPSDGPVYRGDHFFHPAKTLVTHLNVPGSVSQTYTNNVYLESF